MTHPQTAGRTATRRSAVPGADPAAVRQIVAPPVGRNAAVPERASGVTAMAARILLYSHDTFGLGHFRRCMKISRHLISAFPNSSILLMTGSPLAHRYTLPAGIDYIKLPAVVKIGRDRYRARSAQVPIEDLIRIRSGIIQSTVKTFRPDIFLVDHAPLGLQGELLPVLRDRDNPTRPLMVIGLRDILDSPERVTTSWRANGIYEVLETLYDRIVVYGTPFVYDPVTAYEFPDTLRRKTLFTGYVCGHDEATPRKSGRGASRRGRQVLLTVGGGEDGGLIVETYLQMLRAFRTRIDFSSVLLPGPLLSDASIRAYRRLGAGLPVRIHRFVTEIGPLMARADLTIAMGGYNTVTEILAHAKRALVIPRSSPRVEQLIRARRFAELKLLQVLTFEDLRPDRLFETISALLADDGRALADARRTGLIDTNGTAQLANMIGACLAQRRTAS